MKTVILCGGKGTRLAEETIIRPKPMVTVGARPILWHIMKSYSHFGQNDFVLALGYLGDVIKDYFRNYYALNSDFRVDLSTGEVNYHRKTNATPWTVDLIDTGDETLTGGRLLRLKPLLETEGTFMLTYGDGVCDVDVSKLLEFHRSHGKLCTVTAVRPTARFGGMGFDGKRVTSFKEKPQSGEGWINGGFFVMEPGVFDYLQDDRTILERDPMEGLTADGQLMAYHHDGFWQCMDTVRDREVLETAWETGRAPWRFWE